MVEKCRMSFRKALTTGCPKEVFLHQLIRCNWCQQWKLVFNEYNSPQDVEDVDDQDITEDQM